VSRPASGVDPPPEGADAGTAEGRRLVLFRKVRLIGAIGQEEWIMSFIQIIDYETDRAAEIDAAMRAMLADMPVDPGFVRLEQTQDLDNPRHYMTIVEFPSYEMAMANNNRPETGQMARELASMCTRGPEYRNLDVQMQMP
jgi:quinol monooxygenase YgiN